MKTCSLYGFSSELAPFAGKSPAAQVDLLRTWGNTAIFGGYQDAAFVEAAHAAGLPIYAEFGCFAGKGWWERVPSSRPVTAEGNPLEPDGWYCGVNPTVPEARRVQLEALEKLVIDYPIDGVWLDFIRWPCHWEVPAPYLPRTSFDAGTLARFGQDTGIDVPPDDPPVASQKLLKQHDVEWTAWRCAQITAWVAEARALLDRVRPGLMLGFFGVPWRLSDYDGAILKVIGQDYRALGPYVDVFSPMVYHKMCNLGVDWIAQVTEEIHALTGKPVWPIIQSVDEPLPLPAAEYDCALQTALNCPAADGVLVFTLKGALDETKLAVTQARFGRRG
ncbi:MAG: hypothetical protein JW934_18650 [Anaerolineae bacterium]|nr:hypothetical protein [Anaerolineae bacterium]